MRRLRLFVEFWVGPVREPYTWLIIAMMAGVIGLDGGKSLLLLCFQAATVVINIVTWSARRSVREAD